MTMTVGSKVGAAAIAGCDAATGTDTVLMARARVVLTPCENATIVAPVTSSTIASNRSRFTRGGRLVVKLWMTWFDMAVSAFDEVVM